MRIKHCIVLLHILILFSCGKDKSVLLPEIENANITEVLDVSPAYLFYDETQPDGVELNRKNLIGTTNWLFNVDKRLTLKQSIPKIKFLQDKKRNAQMHKNENAKNYYTCNDISIQNLGFIEFTNVKYQTISLRDYLKDKYRSEKISMALNVISSDSFSLESSDKEYSETKLFSKLTVVMDSIKKHFNTETESKLYVLFNSNLSFQDYITIKSKLQELENDGISTDQNEFIY